MMIIIECNNDKQLMFRLGFTKTNIVHAGSKGIVLERLNGETKPAIGIVDEDDVKKLQRLLKDNDIDLVIKKGKKNSIALTAKRNDKTKSLIVISPRLEEWIYKVAKRNGINPTKYDLPEDPDMLHNDTSKESEKGFRDLLVALNKKKDWEIELMRKWINEAMQQ